MYLKHHYEETIINRKYGICNFYSEIWGKVVFLLRFIII